MGERRIAILDRPANKLLGDQASDAGPGAAVAVRDRFARDVPKSLTCQ
jgi:hypothetical protein